ncbi:MAG TPA: aldo/keto reductase [Planctomycetota bacterium]|nr:aldo/keto reductase [Planctomycetota bacterium]HRR82611.1 aldo/keto reductase [Planctomycetota bacterium]HRT94795.1 aldo/keto reductase [Planctomycetota bacterium]
MAIRSSVQVNRPAPGRGLSRRAFLRSSASAGAGLVVFARPLRSAEAVEPLPTRVLGRTKAKVTILGLGTAPIGEGPVDTPEASKIFGAVLDQGVTYVDTARSYGNAEEALAQVVPQRRDQLFLATKCWTDSGAQAQKLFETSLRTLKVDYLDLVHIHNMGNKDPGKVLAKDGILEYLLKQKEAGKLRFIGLSGHERPPRFLEVLKTGQIDVVMPVMNYADRHIYGFEDKVLPECRKQGVGVVAMKVYVGIKGGFPNHRKGSVGCVTKPELLPQAMAYVLDLEGVSVANIGPYTMEQALQNVAFARQYKPLAEAERAELLALGKQIAADIGPRYGPVA